MRWAPSYSGPSETRISLGGRWGKTGCSRADSGSGLGGVHEFAKAVIKIAGLLTFLCAQGNRPCIWRGSCCPAHRPILAGSHGVAQFATPNPREQAPFPRHSTVAKSPPESEAFSRRASGRSLRQLQQAGQCASQAIPNCSLLLEAEAKPRLATPC